MSEEEEAGESNAFTDALPWAFPQPSVFLSQSLPEKAADPSPPLRLPPGRDAPGG